MKELYKTILDSMSEILGDEKYDAISGMEDVLRCEGFPNEGKPVFAKLQECLLSEKDSKAQSLICDALYEGMLNQYDDVNHIEGLKHYLNSGDPRMICMAIDVFGGAINDSYRELIERFLQSDNDDVRETAKRNL